MLYLFLYLINYTVLQIRVCNQNLMFLNFNQNIYVVGTQKNCLIENCLIEHPKQMVKLMDKKILTILRHNFLFIWRPAAIHLYSRHTLMNNSFHLYSTSYELFRRPLVKSVYQKIMFFIFQPKHILWVLKRTVGSFEHPIHMLKLMDKKIFTIFHSKNFFLSKPMSTSYEPFRLSLLRFLQSNNSLSINLQYLLKKVYTGLDKQKRAA